VPGQQSALLACCMRRRTCPAFCSASVAPCYCAPALLPGEGRQFLRSRAPPSPRSASRTNTCASAGLDRPQPGRAAARRAGRAGGAPGGGAQVAQRLQAGAVDTRRAQHHQHARQPAVPGAAGMSASRHWPGRPLCVSCCVARWSGCGLGHPLLHKALRAGARPRAASPALSSCTLLLLSEDTKQAAA